MIISMMMSRTQSTVIMAIETEMFRLLFSCHGKGGEPDGVIYEREGTVGYVWK